MAEDIEMKKSNTNSQFKVCANYRLGTIFILRRDMAGGRGGGSENGNYP